MRGLGHHDGTLRHTRFQRVAFDRRFQRANIYLLSLVDIELHVHQLRFR